ncbi:MAG: Nramp family divalent metal transporter [Gelidibacter sp.]
MAISLKQFGPGLLFAGAAIGVSHLVQSTRAGADFGFGLVWALILVNLFKYPFFQFGPRYALATGESLLEGYKKLGKGVLLAYFILSLATMFTIQLGVTIVTAGLASSLFGDFISVKTWTFVILGICFIILAVGKYRLLDRLMKIIVITLSISTLMAVLMALFNIHSSMTFVQVFPNTTMEIGFLIAFMGWMPAPLDISVWQSLWALEKQKESKSYDVKTSIFDFNVGFITTIILGLGFVALGALVMFNSGQTFSESASGFSNQLIQMYVNNLGHWSYPIIGIAAFATMFSTTLSTLDASPRSMEKAIQLLLGNNVTKGYHVWLIILTIGTVLIFFFLNSEMGLLIKIATILSFLTAPFYAIANYRLISSKHTPHDWQPTVKMHVLSCLGILFLIGFSLWYLHIL